MRLVIERYVAGLACLRVSTVHRQPTPLQVDPIPPQAARLAHPQSRVDRQQNRRRQVITKMGQFGQCRLAAAVQVRVAGLAGRY